MHTIISIHAPRVGCDTVTLGSQLLFLGISIHAPRVGCDAPLYSTKGAETHDFNPRTPCGVRRFRQGVRRLLICYFNPRTPCGVRPGRPEHGAGFWKISIHAPRVGCDSRWSAAEGDRRISIHAPRVGCDTSVAAEIRSSTDFNPRTPCGVRLGGVPISHPFDQFQSTHPVWGATLTAPITVQLTPTISIHAPRVGCDRI